MFVMVNFTQIERFEVKKDADAQAKGLSSSFVALIPLPGHAEVQFDALHGLSLSFSRFLFQLHTILFVKQHVYFTL